MLHTPFAHSAIDNLYDEVEPCRRLRICPV